MFVEPESVNSITSLEHHLLRPSRLEQRRYKRVHIGVCVWREHIPRYSRPIQHSEYIYLLWGIQVCKIGNWREKERKKKGTKNIPMRATQFSFSSSHRSEFCVLRTGMPVTFASDWKIWNRIVTKSVKLRHLISIVSTVVEGSEGSPWAENHASKSNNVKPSTLAPLLVSSRAKQASKIFSPARPGVAGEEMSSSSSLLVQESRSPGSKSSESQSIESARDVYCRNQTEEVTISSKAVVHRYYIATAFKLGYMQASWCWFDTLTDSQSGANNYHNCFPSAVSLNNAWISNKTQLWSYLCEFLDYTLLWLVESDTWTFLRIATFHNTERHQRCSVRQPT